RVSILVSRWRQLHNVGRAPSVEELCAECPELSDAVARQIHDLTSRESQRSHTAQETPAAPRDDEDDRTERLTDGGLADRHGTLRTPAGKNPPPAAAHPGLNDSRVVRGYRLVER